MTFAASLTTSLPQATDVKIP